ncbi:uncharacterized protein LOC143611566 [Bidens hawaiensis]|uniref:uncharacterized protein LOC143611566 n=1 Tax=Bidens hawaiensis TaxID=980011 RepID=UPI004049C5A8
MVQSSSGSTSGVVKDGGTPALHCPMLNSINYTDAIDPGSQDAKQNSLAVALLFQAIPEDQVMQVGNMAIAKEMWAALKTRHMGADRVREAALQTLTQELDNMRMKETETIDEYSNRLSGVASRSASLGEVVDEMKLVKKFLTSLPRRYIHIVASIEQTVNLKEVGYEEVVGRLKAYEKRIDNEELHADGRLMFGRFDSYNNRKGDNVRGRGRGSYGNRGRGRGRSGSQDRERVNNEAGSSSGITKPKKDRSKVQCYRCDQLGHFASACLDRKPPKQ